MTVENHHPQQIDVLVDNEPARRNVARYLESQGYRTRIEQVGQTTNMLDIVTAMQLADKVINI